MAGYCTEPLSSKCESLKFYLEENIKWMKESIGNDHGLLNPSPYWHHVSSSVLILFSFVLALETL